MELSECNSDNYTPDVIYIINAKDLKYNKKGEIVGLKRKYGKHTRETYKFKLNTETNK